MLVDSHCHLDRLKLEAYKNGLDDAIIAATERDVSAMLCVCISEENKANVLSIAEKYQHIHASVGVHPCDVDSHVVTVDMLRSWADHPKVVALGETGLDYYHSDDKKALQKQSFIAHLEASKLLSLPVIVHTRDAREDTIDLIRDHSCKTSAGVLHCFTESWEMAQEALELNFYISLSGIVTFKNAKELKEVARRLPLERLLIETDSPYLAPMPYRGKPNEPKYVHEVAQYLADLKGVSFESLAKVTTENYYNLFTCARLREA